MSPKKKAVPPSSDVDDVLGRLQEDLNSQFGEETASRLTDANTLSKVDHWVSTRSIVADAVLRGGRPVGSSLVPFGRMMEVSGPENSGKTTLCAQIAAEVQAKGGLVLVTDTEERIDHAYWAALGVDLSRVMHISSHNLSDCFNKQFRALELSRKYSDKLTLLLWDSLGGTKGADIEVGGDEDPMEQANKFGMRRAKIISDGMELVNYVIGQTRACYLFTNHEYTKIGVSYGETRETRGGNKPKYFATVRLRLTPGGKIKEADPVSGRDRIIGQRVYIRALKNSMSGFLLDREAVLMAGKGFVNEYTVFEAGRKLGSIEGKGSWSTWHTPSGEEVKFQGFSGFMQKVYPHPEYTILVENVIATML